MQISLRSYPVWANFILYQSIWLLCVFGQNQLLWLVGLLLGVHFILVHEKLVELLTVLSCALLGVLLDSILTVMGIFVFSPSPAVLPIPAWLVAIWVGFATTFRHSLSYFFSRPLILMCCAVIGAPLAYLAAQRFGAVEFPLGLLNTALLLAIVWPVLTYVFIKLVAFIDSARNNNSG